MQMKKQISSYPVAPLFHKAALQFVMEWKEPIRVTKSWIEGIERVAACNPKWPRHMANQDWGGSYHQAPNLAAALLNFLRERWASLERQKHGKLKWFLAGNLSVPWDDSFKKSRASIQEAKELHKICAAHAPKWFPAGNLSVPRDDSFNKSRASIQEAKELQKICAAPAPKLPPLGGSQVITQAELDQWEFCQKVWAGRKFPGPVPSTIGDVCVLELEDRDLANAFEKSPGGYCVSKQTIHDVRRQINAEHHAADKFAKEVLDKDGFLQAGCKPRRRKKRIVRARK